jgi:DNA primase
MLNSIATSTYSRRTERVDVEVIKQAHPIREVVAWYGIELRLQGRADVGRCPFHADGGRPNLFVWADTHSWRCFRCNVGGDVIRFVELADGVGFREAVERLGGAGPCDLAARLPAPPARPASRGFADRDSEEIAALQAATAVYLHRLLADPQALAYVAQRGLDRVAVQSYRIGYAAGDELVPYLRWRRLPLGPALRLGLLNHTGRELLAGRIVVPEFRDGQPVWLVGRILEHDARADGDVERAPPK